MNFALWLDAFVSRRRLSRCENANNGTEKTSRGWEIREVWGGMRVGRQGTRWEDETENGINALWFLKKSTFGVGPGTKGIDLGRITCHIQTSRPNS